MHITCPIQKWMLVVYNLRIHILTHSLFIYYSFLTGIFTQLGSTEPSPTSSKSELSKQNAEFAMLHFKRLLIESETRVPQAWTRVKLPPFNFPIPVDVAIHYVRTSRQVINARIDLVFHGKEMSASRLRDSLCGHWSDPKSFESLFGQGSLSECN